MRLVRSLAPLVLAVSLLAACVSSSNRTEAPVREDVVLRGEIERRVAEIPYMHGVELVANLERLAAIGDPAVPYLVRALGSDSWLTRSSAAWTLGVMGDRRNIPQLRELLDDRVPGVRYQAAASLVELGDGAGFAVLVEGLSDPDLQARYKCFESLRDATGNDFGYEHDAEPTRRRAAVTRWQDWLQGVRASAL